jgi:uncharacterized protein YodC (DUF2158 family)
MDEEKIKAGDVVKLKSGGPDVTVVRELADGNVEIAWFNEHSENGTASLSGAVIGVAALEPA